MNKKIIIFIGLILLIIRLVISSKSTNGIKKEIKPTPTPLLQVVNFPIVKVKDNNYAYDLVKVADISKLTLIKNNNAEKGKDLIKKHLCQLAVNGGFYDKNNQVIGLFVSDSVRYSETIVSRLFDGFFSIDKDNQINLSRQNPVSVVKLALQSGPMLYLNGQAITLLIADDKPARRVIIFLDKKNQLYFLTVFNQEFRYQGPNLADLPLIIKEIAQKEKVEIKEALNLDGGSASFFHSKKATLEEYNPIGSLFCVK